MENTKPSISEDHGIAAMRGTDLMVYSVGISTCGMAEIRMAEAEPERHIVATTLDRDGLAFTREFIEEHGFSDQIDARLENVAEPLPYDNDSFDYIYARLVLHYLTKQELEKTLVELRRVLRPGGRLFAVVRSEECPDFKENAVDYDPNTHMTTYPTGERGMRKRYFHTEESITGYLMAAGFVIDHVVSYEERLSPDFLRAELSENRDEVIEVLATKEPVG